MTKPLHFIFVSSQVEGFHFNSNILETNLVNIIILIVLLVYVVGSFLKESLSLRQEEIIQSIQESEKRFNEANQRYFEAKAQMKQAQILIQKIQAQNKATIRKIGSAGCSQIFQNIQQQLKNEEMLFTSSEQQAFNNLVKQISHLALNDTQETLQKKLDNEDHSYIIDMRLSCLGGKNGH